MLENPDSFTYSRIIERRKYHRLVYLDAYLYGVNHKVTQERGNERNSGIQW